MSASHLIATEGWRAKGMDYGVPPRLMLVANPVFDKLWGAAGCGGVGYLQIPQFRDESNVPAACLMFDDLDRGVELFRLLKSWDLETDSGKGLNVSFIVDQPNKSYTLLLAPNIDELLARFPDQSALEDYNVLTTAMGLGKDLPDTRGGVGWLRKQAAQRALLLVPGDPSRLRMEYAIKKADVKFYDVDKVPENTFEHFVINKQRMPERPRVNSPSMIEPAAVALRRQRQLKRFFGVTLARLAHNQSWQAVRHRLNGRYVGWQLNQAACNLIAAERYRKTAPIEKGVAFHVLYEAMRRTPEPIADDLPLKWRFTDQELEAQIVEDCCYLQEQLELEEGDSIQILGKHGLLQ